MKLTFKHVPKRVLPLTDDMLKACSPEAIKHIKNSMRSLEQGLEPTPSFKLYGRSDVGLVDDFFKSIKSRVKVPKWQLKYEMSRKTKWGPQGGYAKWDDVIDDFNMYYDRPVDVSADYDYLLSSNLNQKYSKMNLKVIPINETLAKLIANDKINDRAAGWRDFNLSKKDPVAQEHAVRDARSGLWREGMMYVFERFNKQKKRIFFPGPYSLMLLEAQYYQPFLNYIQNDLRTNGCDSPYIFWADKIGFSKQFKIVDDLYQRMNHHGTIVHVQRDFERMDTTQGFSQTIHGLYRKLTRAFGFTISSPEANRLFEILYTGSIMPVITPSGVYYGSRGKASGQETTNGDETCSNEDYDDILQGFLEMYCKECGITYRLVYSGGNGDDGMTIYYLDTPELLDKFKECISKAANVAADICGFRVQGDKWHISTEYGLYCQNMVSLKDGHIWYGYPASLILNAIVNPEKEYSKADWDKDYRDLDIIVKLDNGRNLEYFHELVDYVDNGMKFGLLGRTETETRRILSKYERYRALQSTKFNHVEDELDEANIFNSPTVNYILSKRKLVIPR